MILDDYGHKKSGSFISGVRQQSIGEIGKIDIRIITVTTHNGWWQKKVSLTTWNYIKIQAFYIQNKSTSAIMSKEAVQRYNATSWFSRN